MRYDGLRPPFTSSVNHPLLIARRLVAWLGLAAILIALLGWSPAMSAPRTIVLAADIWCPLNCEPSDRHPGLMIEILKATLEPHGYVINYQLMPWERALTEARNGRIDGVIGVNHTEAVGLVSHRQSAGITTLVMVTLKDRNIRFSGVASLDTLRVGAIEGYSYSEAVDTWIEANRSNHQRLEFAFGVRPLDSNIRKLVGGYIDVFPEVKEVVWLRLRHLGLLDQVVLHDAGLVEEVYFGFSPNRPDLVEVARLLDAGISDLRRSGRLTSILRVYGIKDWAK